tara:strand:+ start:849 stop:1793 length:945 start_codon:yes stop_codon:yes gene_type:complete
MNEYKKLLEQGFSKVSNVLSDNELRQLKEECLKILNDQNNISYKNIKNNFKNDLIEYYDNSKTQDTFFKTKIRPFIGISKEIDLIMEKIIFRSGISEILEKLLIKPKLSHCMIRLADNQSNFLGFHTDSDTTLSMSIFLDDVSNHDATTTFIPKSHLYPSSLKNKIEKINPDFFGFLSKNSTGKAGDVNLFFNKTVHGVKTATKKYNSNNAVLLLNFHCDYDDSHRNLLLSDNIKYEFENGCSNKFIENYFESAEHDRESRIKNKNISNTPISEVFNQQRLPYFDYLIFYFLNTIAFFLSNTVFIYRRFFKKSY